MDNYGALRVVSAGIDIVPGDIEHNIDSMVNRIKEINSGAKLVSMIVFPELACTGMMGDQFFMAGVRQLFHLSNLRRTLEPIVSALSYRQVAFIGAPVYYGNRLYDCAVAINSNGVVSIIPKVHVSQAESRWFTSGKDACIGDYKSADILSVDIYEVDTAYIGVEVGDDLLAVMPPSLKKADAGAHIIVNCGSSRRTIGGRHEYRDAVREISKRGRLAYIYSSSDALNNSDLYEQQNMVYCLGERTLVAEGCKKSDGYVVADIPINQLMNEKLRCAWGNSDAYMCEMEVPAMLTVTSAPVLPAYPFRVHYRNREYDIFDMQVKALMLKWKSAHSDSVVIGVSGGVDSTLTLLVADRARRLLGYGKDSVVCVTMPYIWTTSKTKDNAIALAEGLGYDILTISISESVKQHLKDIGLPEDDRSVAYENAQARERTQILMDLGNVVNGFVLSTGDMSEAALGWCTYNGDHMGMYNTNSGLPKTVIYDVLNELIHRSRENGGYQHVGDIISSILSTPVSPELLGEQRTEDVVGPYVLNDFILYHVLWNGFSSGDIEELLVRLLNEHEKMGKPLTSKKYTKEDVHELVGNFFNRFKRAQFKRNCSPDGVNIFDVSLDGSSGWVMNSIAAVQEM